VCAHVHVYLCVSICMSSKHNGHSFAEREAAAQYAQTFADSTKKTIYACVCVCVCMRVRVRVFVCLFVRV